MNEIEEGKSMLRQARPDLTDDQIRAVIINLLDFFGYLKDRCQFFEQIKIDTSVRSDGPY